MKENGVSYCDGCGVVLDQKNNKKAVRLTLELVSPSNPIDAQVEDTEVKSEYHVGCSPFNLKSDWLVG